MHVVSIERSAPISSGASIKTVERPVVSLPVEQMEDLRATAQTLAATDSAFRAALVRDPRGVLAQLIKANSNGAYELPREIHVSTIQDGPAIAYVVVPSSDKVSTSQTELARLSKAVVSEPELRPGLISLPHQALTNFPVDPNGHLATALQGNRAVEFVFEDPARLLIWIPGEQSDSSSAIADPELRSAIAVEAHMSCITCECITARMCITGECITAANCITWSSSCR